VGELVNGVWFVKIVGGVNGRFVVCIRNGGGCMSRSVVVHKRANGGWEL